MSAFPRCPHGRYGLCLDCMATAGPAPRFTDPPTRTGVVLSNVHYREPFSDGRTACGEAARKWGRSPLRATTDAPAVTCEACLRQTGAGEGEG